MSGVYQLNFLEWLKFAGTVASFSVMALMQTSCNETEDRENQDAVGGVGDASPMQDWPLFRGDLEMQGATGEVLRSPLELAWSFETGEGGERRTPPIEASPIISNGTVFVGTQLSQFLAIDLRSGEEVWRFKAEGAITAPAAAFEDTVFFGDNYGFIYALDIESGEEKWRFETEGKIEGGVNVLPREGESAAVFIGSHDYYLYALDSVSGKVLWQYETGNYVIATPSIINSGGQQAICFGGCDGLLYVIPASGEGDSQEIEVGSYIANSSSVRDGIAYVANNGGEVLAIEVASGEVVWKNPIGPEYTASPAVDEERVYIAGPDKRLVALDRVTGEEVWAFLSRRALDSSPVVSGDLIWQGGMDGRLYAVSRLDGSEVWQYEVGAQIKASPAVSRGMLVLCGSDGLVYAFREQGEKSSEDDS